MPDSQEFPVKHILSFGGGVNTAALMILLIQEQMPLDEVVFADTGGEVPETYDYLKVAADYLETHGIPFRVVANRVQGRDLYANCWHRRVIPSAVWRWATRDFKVRPIFKYYRSFNAHIDQYVGIAWDEVERMKDSTVDYVTNVYPLIERRMTRNDCIRLIEAEGLPVPVKSGCFFCPFNSLDRWAWIHEKHPQLFERAIQLEENSKHFPNQRLSDQVYRHRQKVTMRELGERLAQKYLGGLEVVQEPCGSECMT